MDATVLALIQDMASTSLAFVGSVVTNLWGLLLSLFVLFGVGTYIFRRIGNIGR